MGSMVYFSGRLPKRFPDFFKELSGALKKAKIRWGLLSYTKDIWCRDYMPIKTSEDSFVQFRYDPLYLQTRSLRETITDPTRTCRSMGMKPMLSELIVDGGNVVRFQDKVIMTERVYTENPGYSKEAMIYLLKYLLKAKDLIVIPEEHGDPYGHADGCVRFVNRKTVLINESGRTNSVFYWNLRKILRTRGLSLIELPYFIDFDKEHKHSAVGNYVNYLQVGAMIIAPMYDGYDEANHRAFEVLRKVFGKKNVYQVESTPVAKEGGILNCISWGS